MNIYDELTKVLLDENFVNEEIRAGRGMTYSGQIKMGSYPAIPEKRILIPGTVTKENPTGSCRIVPEVPERPIYEDCLYYHAYTPEELAPTWQETMEAQVLYTSMMTDTLLED